MTATQTRAAYQRVDVNRARTLAQQSETLVLDVRDERSFAAGHIDSAIHVTSVSIDPVISQTPRQTPVLIYCYHGIASQTYAQMFIDFGFRTVYSLDGGYEAWRAA